MPFRLALALATLASLPAHAEDLCQGYRMLESARPAPSTESSFIYKVTKAGTAPSYLLGSFHTDSGSVIRQWEWVALLMEEMRSFAAETSFAPADRLAAGRLTLTEAPALATALGPDFFALVEKQLKENGARSEIIARLKPWAAFLQLAQPPGAAQSLDSFLFRQAARLPLRILPLQSPEEMAASAERLAPADQIRIAREAACNRASVTEQVKRMQALYVAGNVPGFLAEADRLSSPVNGLTERLFTALVGDRNRIFLPRLLPLLERGAALVTVGAGHLYGENGLLRLIQGQGFAVEVQDRATLAADFTARANRSATAIAAELAAWLLTQGISLPAPPAVELVTSPDLEQAACPAGRACDVSLSLQGGKILADIQLFHDLQQREPALMASLLGILVRQAQAAELAAGHDNRCTSWREKNVALALIQGKYLNSLGLPGGGIRPPGIPRDCQ